MLPIVAGMIMGFPDVCLARQCDIAFCWRCKRNASLFTISISLCNNNNNNNNNNKTQLVDGSRYCFVMKLVVRQITIFLHSK